jgi:hypothetical protein
LKTNRIIDFHNIYLTLDRGRVLAERERNGLSCIVEFHESTLGVSVRMLSFLCKSRFLTLLAARVSIGGGLVLLLRLFDPAGDGGVVDPEPLGGLLKGVVYRKPPHLLLVPPAFGDQNSTTIRLSLQMYIYKYPIVYK